MHLTLTSHAPGPSPIRKRLWKLGFAVALMLTTFTVGNAFLSPDKSVGRAMLGHDFLAFYTAGHMVQTEQLDRMYDLIATKEFQSQVEQENHLEVGKGFGPFWNPPFAALAFAPLAALDYQAALMIWMTAGGIALALSIGVLIKILGSADWKAAALVPLFVLACMPTVQAASHGQNTFITLGLLLGVVVLWRNDMGLAAGMVAGLLFYKPQHAAVIAGVLCLSMGRKPILGLLATGLFLVTLNITALPGTLETYLHQLPINLHAMQDLAPYFWERHVTLKAFWRLLLQGGDAGETSRFVYAAWLSCVAAIAVPLALTAWREGGRQWIGSFGEMMAHDHARDRLIAATIAAAPLIMPFSFDYDLLLLAIPAVLWARELMEHPRARLARVDHICMTGWIGLYLWTFINPIIARPLRFDGTVLWLSIVAGSLIVRAMQSPTITATLIDDSDLVGPLLAQAA